MSYCVNCGVELDSTASFCPLCRTPVVNPRQPVDTGSPPPFPTERREVPPASKAELAILVSSMLASVAVCCGLLNLVLRSGHIWSLYVIGAAAMLWVWLVPPLLLRTMHLYLRLSADVLAVALYVFLISVDLDGSAWYWHLALPIILLLGAALLLLWVHSGEQLRSQGMSAPDIAAQIEAAKVGICCNGYQAQVYGRAAAGEVSWLLAQAKSHAAAPDDRRLLEPLAELAAKKRTPREISGCV